MIDDSLISFSLAAFSRHIPSRLDDPAYISRLFGFPNTHLFIGIGSFVYAYCSRPLVGEASVCETD